MTAEPAIEIRGLWVERGGRNVLPGLDIVIERGVVTGLLGPSGCGKSTLMRAIVGVQKVAGGTVTVLGEPAGTPNLRSRVGYVTQAPSIYGDITVRENLEYFARVLDVAKVEVGRVIETVGLGGYEGSTGDRLSGGQRGRLSLASALLNRPDVLILDEPTVGLDPLIREQLWAMFHGLADQGVTLLVSSHAMDEASRCAQLVLMRDGHIVAHESPGELLRRTGAVTLDDAFQRVITKEVAP